MTGGAITFTLFSVLDLESQTREALSAIPIITIICIIFSFNVRLLYKRHYYKKNPTIKIYTKFFVEGTLCPKCRMGKICFSKLFNGECESCFTTVNSATELYVCYNCKTGYPGASLTAYIGPDPSWLRARRRRLYRVNYFQNF